MQTCQQQTKQPSAIAQPVQRQKSRSIQPKLTIGAPNDRYEREADAMADRIMRMPQAYSSQTLSSAANGIQRTCSACSHEKEQIRRKPLMMKSEGGMPVATPNLQTQLSGSKGSGNPMPSAINNQMSQAFNTDFSKVRIHTDSRAAQMNQGLNALAFTHGSDIYFNKGTYNPSSSDGKRLLGHELTHVVQQGEVGQNKIQRQAADACPNGRKEVTVDMLSFDGSTRNPSADLAHANTIYSQCCVSFKLGVGASVDPSFSGPLMGNDTTFERANRSTDSAEESALIPAVTSAFGLNGRLRVLYFERFNPSARGTSHRATGSTALTVNHVYMANHARDRSLAHEFGHILLNGNFHHLPADNLMHVSNTATASNITPAQCTSIHSNI